MPGACAVRLGLAQAWVLVALLVVALLVADDGLAASRLERGHEVMRVGVLSPGSYVRDASDLFQESPDVTRLRLETGLWTRRLEAQLRSRDHVMLRPSGELRTRLQTQGAAKTSAVLVREAFSLGVERYRGLKVKSARKLFERALKLAESIHWDVVRPTELADIAFYRGLCLVEEGDLNKARLAFRETFLLDPGRRFQKGYYPETVESSLRDAWETLSVETEKARLLHPIHRLHQLANKARVDAFFILHFDSLDGQIRAHVTIFDRQSRGIVASARFPIEELARHLDRFVSRWHTCALQTRRMDYLSEPAASTTLDMGYNHGLYLHHRRARALLQSPGVSFGLSYLTSKNVHIFGRLTHLETLPDKNGDLLDPFGLTHLALGAGLGGDVGRLGVFVEIGLEVAVAFRDITMTDDVDCKHFGSDHPRCTRLFTMDAPGFFFGLVFNSGVRFRLKRGWYLQAQGGISAYFLEKDFVADINYPLVIRLGVAHRF